MGLFDKYKKSNINESVDWEKSMDENNNNLDRIKRLKNLQVDIPPVMGDALEDDEKFDKNSKEVFTKLAKDAKDIIPENPGTGKKVTIKPYTEKLTLDENLFKESWVSYGGSWRGQTVKSVTYEEDDISDIAEELMNWYGEYFEGWEGPDIKSALYGLDGERIPGSDCPIIFTMEESDEDEYDWGSDDDDEEYDESLNTKLKEDNYDRPGYENMYLVSWEDSIGDYHESKVKADYPQHAIDKIKKSKHIYKVINVEKINMFTAPKRIRKAELIEEKKEKSKHLCEDFGVREYSDRLYDMIEDDMVDAKKIAEDLIYWCSEDDVAEYMRVNNLILDDEDMEESLNESTDRYFIKVFDEDGNYNILAKDNSIYSKNYVAYDRTHGAHGDSKKIKKLEDNDKSFLLKYGYKSKDSAKKAANGFNKAEIIKISLDESFKSLLEKKSLDEDWVLEPGKTFRSKSNNEITIKEVIPYVSEYDGTPSLRIKYDYVLNNGKFGSSECSAKDLFNMLNESVNLLEYASEDEEDDEYTVYDLLNDRLFGYGINKSNFRVKWKFAEVEPTVKTRDGKLKRGYFYPTIHQDELVTGKSDDRRAFTEDGIGVFVHDEDEASLVKKCAEELNLDFVMKKLVRPHNGFNYVATIKVSDDIQEMPIKDYMESIGKSMSDLLRGKEDKIKSNFKDSKNYQSRKTNKEQQETAEE